MRKGLFVVLFALVFLAFALGMGAILRAESAPKPSSGAHIAVIMYGNESNDRWKALDQGVRQACRELEMESPVINTASSMDTDMQLRLIDRELAAGAKGLVIAAEDSAEIAARLAESPLSAPVVFAKNGVPDTACVSADNAGMAQELAESLRDVEGRIVLLRGDLRRDSVEARFDAFLAEMQAQGRAVDILDTAAEDDVEALRRTRAGERGRLVVALDTDTLEKAIDAIADRQSSARLYGIGSSDKVVHALNQGMLEGVVFQNEYAIGYIATMQLVAKMGLAKGIGEAPIQYMYIDRASMFQPEAEHLLFPIIQ